MVKVAIVGGGISGISSAYLLTQGQHQVTVFEKGSYLGGHTNTVDATFGDQTVKVDTGFIVFNDERYPNLIRFFKELGVESHRTDISFSYSLNARKSFYNQDSSSDLQVVNSNNNNNNSSNQDAGSSGTSVGGASGASSADGADIQHQHHHQQEQQQQHQMMEEEEEEEHKPIDYENIKIRPEIEWSSIGFSSIFAQPKNIFSISFWRMLIDMFRFQNEGPKVLDDTSKYHGVTIREYIASNNYSEAFVNYYLIPVMSALWSTSFKEIDSFPILTLVRFFQNHNMFQLVNRPLWNTVKGCSYQYMIKARQYLESHGTVVRLNSPVQKITRNVPMDGKMMVKVEYKNSLTEEVEVEYYDSIIMACHPPDILPMITNITEQEYNVMSKFKYTPHTAYLHSDERLMPTRRWIWSAWNYIYDDRSSTESKVCVTYWMNILQPWLDAKKTPLYVTLNPVFPPNPALVHKVIEYEHPLYNDDSEQSRQRLTTIQGTQNTYYCGAYYGFGFHEDGITSGLLAAQLIDPSLEQIWKVDINRYRDVPLALQEKQSNIMAVVVKTSLQIGIVGVVAGLLIYKPSYIKETLKNFNSSTLKNLLFNITNIGKLLSIK